MPQKIRQYAWSKNFRSLLQLKKPFSQNSVFWISCSTCLLQRRIARESPSSLTIRSAGRWALNALPLVLSSSFPPTYLKCIICVYTFAKISAMSRLCALKMWWSEFANKMPASGRTLNKTPTAQNDERTKRRTGNISSRTVLLPPVIRNPLTQIDSISKCTLPLILAFDKKIWLSYLIYSRLHSRNVVLS